MEEAPLAAWVAAVVAAFVVVVAAAAVAGLPQWGLGLEVLGQVVQRPVAGAQEGVGVAPHLQQQPDLRREGGVVGDLLDEQQLFEGSILENITMGREGISNASDHTALVVDVGSTLYFKS